MKSIRTEFDRLIEVFRGVHSEKGDAAVDDRWQHEVMRRIRNLEPADFAHRLGPYFDARGIQADPETL